MQLGYLFIFLFAKTCEKAKLYITSQQNRLALECRLSALADISHSFADAVY
jgi:hypothetical protein